MIANATIILVDELTAEEREQHHVGTGEFQVKHLSGKADMQIVLVQRQQVLAQIIGTDVVIVHSVEPCSHQVEHRRGILNLQFR